MNSSIARTSVLLGIALALFTAVVLVGGWIRGSADANAFDISLLTQLAHTRTPVLVGIAQGNALLFGVVGALVVASVTAGLIWAFTKSFALAWRFVVVVASGWAVVEIAKRIVQRPRPTLIDVPEVTPIPESFSYPSGHTAFAVALGCALIAVTVWSNGRRRTLVSAVIVAIVLAFGTAFCRMYLGVHHLTDVVASLVLVPVICLGAAVLLGPRPVADTVSDNLRLV